MCPCENSHNRTTTSPVIVLLRRIFFEGETTLNIVGADILAAGRGPLTSQNRKDKRRAHIRRALKEQEGASSFLQEQNTAYTAALFAKVHVSTRPHPFQPSGGRSESLEDLELGRPVARVAEEDDRVVGPRLNERDGHLDATLAGIEVLREDHCKGRASVSARRANG
jgi:hypothetical protein